MLIIVIALCGFSLTYWHRLDDVQQKMLLDDIGYWQQHGKLSPRMQKNLSGETAIEDSAQYQQMNKIKAKESVAVNNIEASNINDVSGIENLGEQKHLQRSDFVCYRTPSKKVTREQSKVYMWVDESGRKHFSDKIVKAKGSAKDISKSFGSRADYFELNISADGELPAFFEQNLSTELKQVFYILSQGLALEGLPKITLNLQVFMDKTAFDIYKNQHAPGLGHATGFFSPKTNKAVVYYNKQRPKASMGLIRHESSHVIMAALFGYTPIWFNEGLAQYFETLYLQGQQKQVSPNAYSHQFLKRYVKAQNRLALDVFFSYQPMQFYQPQSVRLNYYLAWSIMHFMLSDDSGQRVFKALISEMAANPCQGIDMVVLLDKHYAGGAASFANDLKLWILQAQLPTHNY